MKYNRIVKTFKEKDSILKDNKVLDQVKITKGIWYQNEVENACLKLNYKNYDKNDLESIEFDLLGTTRHINLEISDNQYVVIYEIMNKKKKIEVHSISYQIYPKIKLEQYNLEDNYITSLSIKENNERPTINFIAKEKGELYPDIMNSRVLDKNNLKYICDQTFMEDTSVLTIEMVLDIILEYYPEFEKYRDFGYYGQLKEQLEKCKTIKLVK